ncbi:MAG: hypothetical protein H6799_02260 [Candidatus Nomurabacteria bacterium]|nr:MAG: hypothetical protein H6799_02260 [Candidatus Nomurabacteria bacterium]HRV76308.1 hypothetical protein [Candidatus Saccharimonadales bacterium]
MKRKGNNQKHNCLSRKASFVAAGVSILLGTFGCSAGYDESTPQKGPGYASASLLTAEQRREDMGKEYVEFPKDSRVEDINTQEVARYCTELDMIVYGIYGTIVCAFEPLSPYPIGTDITLEAAQERKNYAIQFCIDVNGRITKVAPDEDQTGLRDLVLACEFERQN